LDTLKAAVKDKNLDAIQPFAESVASSDSITSIRQALDSLASKGSIFEGEPQPSTGRASSPPSPSRAERRRRIRKGSGSATRPC
jgi:hypothetical protein